MQRRDVTTARVLLTAGLVSVEVSVCSAAAQDRAPRQVFLNPARKSCGRKGMPQETADAVSILWARRRYSFHTWWMSYLNHRPVRRESQVQESAQGENDSRVGHPAGTWLSWNGGGGNWAVSGTSCTVVCSVHFWVPGGSPRYGKYGRIRTEGPGTAGFAARRPTVLQPGGPAPGPLVARVTVSSVSRPQS